MRAHVHENSRIRHFIHIDYDLQLEAASAIPNQPEVSPEVLSVLISYTRRGVCVLFKGLHQIVQKGRIVVDDQVVHQDPDQVRLIDRASGDVDHNACDSDLQK
jgi:hypothetical protein